MMYSNAAIELSAFMAQLRSMGDSPRFNVDPELMGFVAGSKTPEIMGLADYWSRLRSPVRDRAGLRNRASSAQLSSPSAP